MDQKKHVADYLQDPHLSRGTKAYLKVLNAGDRPVESLPPVGARRVLADAQASVAVDLSGVDTQSRIIEADGFVLPLYIVRPRGAEGLLPAFLFAHGGGWVLGDFPTHERLVRDLVVASGCAAVFVEYTPSPEARFPRPLHELYAALKWVALCGGEIGVDTEHLAVAGNSAGGNMALAIARRAVAEQGPAIRGQLLLWPVTDASQEWVSCELYGTERFLTASLMQWMFDQYAPGSAARGDLRISPVRAHPEQLAGLPPTWIAVAENDILRDQGEALGRLLDEAGVACTTVRFNGVIHDWGLLNGYARLPQTRSLVTCAGAMLRSWLCPEPETGRS